MRFLSEISAVCFSESFFKELHENTVDYSKISISNVLRVDH